MLPAQHIFSRQVYDKAKLEQIIVANQKAIDKNDTIALKQKLDIAKRSNQKDSQGASTIIVYKILLANAYYNALDQETKRSTDLFLSAIKDSNTKDLKNLNLWANVNYAFYLYMYRHMNKTLPVFLNVSNQLKNTPDEEVLDISETYKKVGFFMGTLGEPQEAVRHLKVAAKYAQPNSSNLATILDNIGFYHVRNNEYEKAIPYFIQAGKIAKSIGDEVRLAKVKGNLAEVNLNQGQLKEAITLIDEDILLSKKNKSTQNTMYALTLKAKIQFAQNKIDAAEKTALQADSIAKIKSYNKRTEYELTQLQLKIAQIKKDPNAELAARKKLDIINDSLANRDGDETLRAANWTAKKATYQSQINQEKKNAEKASTRNTILYIIAGLLAATSLLIFMIYMRRLKNLDARNQRNLQLLKSQKIKSDQKLERTENTLSSYIAYLEEKNLQIETLETELRNIEEKNYINKELHKDELNKLLESHLMTDENWNRFKDVFTKENEDYLQYIEEHYEDLTESNIRLIILLKIGLGNKQISHVLGVSQDSIKKAKQRLRKKLGERFDVLFEEANEDITYMN